MLPLVSIVLPCRNEARYIGRCLDSLLASTYPQDRLELLVVDGRSEDRTREIVQRYADLHPWIRLLDNPRRIVPAALNLGIEAARGDVVVRMDAHALYPPEYLMRVVTGLRKSGADNVGGPVIVLPADRTATGRAIALALAHPFGVGNSWFRIGSTQPRYVDTVAYGCWRRELFDKVGRFDEDLVRDQDEEFNYRTLASGGKVLLLPDAVSYYYARPTRRLAGRMLFQYGYFKPLVALKIGRVMTLRQLAPPAFVVALVLGALLAPLWDAARDLWFGMLLAYGTARAIALIGAARGHGIRVAAALIAVFPVLHVSYGAGFLQGLWRNLVGRGLRWRDPAAVPLSR